MQVAACGVAFAQTAPTTGASAAQAKHHAGNEKGGRFREEKNAGIVIRYYREDTSYVLKPLLMDGQFRTICDRDFVLRLATKQLQRDLAVVMLVHYDDQAVEDAVKLGWVKDLQKLHYRRIVFLRADTEMHANGLPIIADFAYAPTVAQATEGHGDNTP